MHSAGRKQALVGLTATALLGLGVFAPAASAQVGTLTETVGSTTTKVTETAGSTTTKITDTVKETTGTTGSTTGSTTTKVTDTVDKVGSTVDTATGGTTYQETKDTVKETTRTTSETVEKTTGSVGGTVEETSGGLVTNPDADPKDAVAAKNTDKKSTAGSAGPGSRKGTVGTRQSQVAAASEAREQTAGRLASLTSFERDRQPGNFSPASAVAPARDSFLTTLGEAAREALEKAAFPLGLALMVGAFLMVQGRIDRKDAKLALAPIDSEQDLLSFQ